MEAGETDGREGGGGRCINQSAFVLQSIDMLTIRKSISCITTLSTLMPDEQAFLSAPAQEPNE